MKLQTPISLKTLSALVKVEIFNPTDQLITGINEIHKVQEGDLSFVDHPKYYKKVLASAASFVLINTKEVENPHNKILLYTEDPFKVYNQLVRHFQPLPTHESIQQKGKVDPSTIVYPNTYIGPKVQIGKNCIIYPNVSIYNEVSIGDNVIIHGNSVIGSDAFYFQKREGAYTPMISCGRVVIEDDVVIGSGCTVDRGVSGATIIGQGSKLDNQIHIGHGCVLGKNCLIAAQVGIAGKTRIGNDVTIWGQVGINKDLDIEDGVTILAKSGVGKRLEAGKQYFGIPVQEARTKMREMATLKHLPEMWEKFKKIQ